MDKSILAALNDSISSRAVVDYMARFLASSRGWRVTLLHIFRKPLASEELMGKKFTAELPARFQTVLREAKEKLAENGLPPDDIETRLVTTPYATISDGIIDQFKERHYGMVIIGRKHMSKAEEFVLGDVSVKLIRALEDTAVLVVKSK